MTARRSLVYAAHSMVTYRTEHEADHLAAIASHFPGWRVLDPAKLYRSNADWLTRWPALVPTLSALVVFADWTGTVGTGVMRELADAFYAGVPTYVLDEDLRHCELTALDLLPARTRVPSAVACPVAGEPACAPAVQSRPRRKAPR